jgi:hypothetical protein
LFGTKGFVVVVVDSDVHCIFLYLLHIFTLLIVINILFSSNLTAVMFWAMLHKCGRCVSNNLIHTENVFIVVAGYV